ncbi:glycosyltransferase, partial [Anaerotignum sp.]
AINRCKTTLGKKLCSYWLRLCAELKWLYPLYIKDDYDIEVAYLECGPTKILAGSTNKKARKLAWIHCDLSKRPGMIAQAEKLKRYYKTYDKVVCVADSVKKSYTNVFGNNPEAIVLHNVNDETEILTKADAFDVPKTEDCTFVSIGRLSYEKGNDRLLEACRRLKKNGYRFQLWLVGDGDEKERLQKFVSENELTSCVTFWGFQNNPYPYMRAADAVVCPSRYEGFSTVITEAMILGKTSVTTPCSGMVELLGDSEFGLIIEDSVEGIYQGMKKMVDNPQLRESYAHAAAERGKAFLKATTVAQTEVLFEDLLKQ